MKFSVLLWPILGLLVILSSGCQLPKTVTAIGNGYQQVSHSERFTMDDPELPRISLEFRKLDGLTIQIWPALSAADMVVKGDLAIFSGDKAYREPAKVTHARLFAVRAPELPLDITDEVLWRWTKANHKNFGSALEKFEAATPEEKDGRLEVHLEFWSGNTLADGDKDWPDRSDLALDLNQVSEIMHAVKTKGVLEKDLRWHTPYIGEKL